MARREATSEASGIEDKTWDEGGYYKVSFAVEKSRRYHEKMAAFYQSWYDWTNILNALCGLGAFLTLFGGKDSIVAQCFVGRVTIISTVATKLTPSKKAQIHTDLQRRFTDLSSSIAGRVASPANLRWATAQRLKIEKDELPVRRLVDLQARNEEAAARGVPASDMIPLSSLQRHLGYIYAIDMKRLEDWRTRRNASSSE